MDDEADALAPDGLLPNVELLPTGDDLDAPAADARRWETRCALFLSAWILGYLLLCGALLRGVPRFKEIFNSMGVELPALTRLFLELSMWVTDNLLLAAPLMLAIGIGTVVPFATRPKDRRLAKGYGLAALAAGLTLVVLILAVFLPIWELQAALEQGG